MLSFNSMFLATKVVKTHICHDEHSFTNVLVYICYLKK